MRRIVLISVFLAAFIISKSQNLSYSCPRDTVLGCNTACFTLKAQFPDVRDLGTDYTLQNVSTQSACRPYVIPGTAGPSTNLDADDTYSSVIPITFTFPFYGVNQTSLVVSTNGEISFDLSNADRTGIDYGILNSSGGLSAGSGTPEDLPSALYEKSIIMGPYHDIEPGPLTLTNSPNQSIRYYVVGTAPNRKWVLSFYTIPLFSCNDLINNTHQIILHESTGIVEVQIIDKEICTGWNEGRAMIGLQDDTRTKAIMAPGRKASDAPWGSIGMNEIWRFIPTGGAPLYRSVELLNSAGTVVATGDTTRINVNTFETTFPNVCPGPGASFYVVKTTYQKLNDPAGTIFSLDTINVIRQAALPVTASMTPTTCGTSSGTITASAAGTPGYQYSLDNGTLQTSPIFTNVSAGPHTIYAVDATGCNNTINIDVTSISNIPSTVVSVNTSCTGNNDGSITVTPTAGVAPYSFSIDGGTTTQPTGLFPNLAPGTYTITFTDFNLCTGTTAPVTITAGAALSGSNTSTNTTCNGATDGTINVVPDVPGSYSYTLNPGAVTNTTGIFTGLAPNNYNVTFTNTVTGCSGTISFISIIVGGTIPSTWTHQDESCPNAHDGIITIIPSVPGSYSYTLTPGPITNTTVIFTGMVPGIFYDVTYTNTVTGCSGSKTFLFVLAGTAITGSQTHTNSSCPGANDGTVNITPSVPGTYTYTLNPGGYTNTTGIFTSLPPNTYTATLANSGGCSATVNNIVVTVGAGPAVTATGGTTTCPGVNDATVTVSPTVAGTYSFTLDPGGYTNNTGIFPGLAPGTYTSTITNTFGCTGTVANIAVTAGPAPTATAGTTATTCLGATNGTVTVTPTVAGSYSYTINPGGTTNTTGIFPNISSGTYSVSFTTPAGCTGTVNNIIVAPGAVLAGTFTPGVTSCLGAADGSITVTPAIAGAYTYTLTPGAITNSTGIFTNLSPDSYSVTFSNASGCSGILSNIPVTAGPSLTGTFTPGTTTCPGVNDATITVTPTVAGAYSYTLTPGAVTNNTGIFPGLAPDSYSVNFTNASGCSGIINNIIVSAGPAPVATASTTATTCPTVNNGTITVTPTGGGGGPYNVTLTGPGGPYNLSDPVAVTFTNLAPGIYTASFTTATGCTGAIASNINLAAGPSLASTFAKADPPCSYADDGTITITPGAASLAPYTITLTGPGGPYTQNVSVPAVFSSLAPGAYNYSFSDANGCAGTGGPITLTTHAPLAILVARTQPLCNGNNNGVIQLAASGGGGIYQYAQSPFTTFQPSGLFNGLIAGTYYFKVKDQFGCFKDTTVTLAQPTLLTASATSPTAATCLGNDGVIIVTANGGTPAYQYLLNAAGSYQTLNTFAVSAGDYANILVKDNKGCIANVALVTVANLDNMFLNVGMDSTICVDQSVTFQPLTNAQTTQFLWSTVPDSTQINTVDNDTLKNATATPRDTTSYVLTATWGVCQKKDTIVLRVKHRPVPDAGPDAYVCYDNKITTLTGNATNLSGTVHYEWSDTTNLQTPHSYTTIATPDTTELFILTVTDEYGCNFAEHDSVLVTVQPPVPAFAGNDTTAATGVPQQLMATGGVSYIWSPSAPLNLATAQNPLASLQNDQQFTVQVTDIGGCIGYDTVFVKVYDEIGYYVPNSFTPNRDGINDFFRPIPVGISYTEYFRVFNRFGEMIFSTNQWLKGWDGTYLGKTQQTGTYVWIVKGVDKKGNKVERKGTVVLIQ